MTSTLADPRIAAKHAAILAAATDVFLEQGYGAASMDEVARRAAVAKQTVYKHFGSKATLFRAMIDGQANALLAPQPAAGDAPAAVLRDLARRFVNRLADPVSVRLLRLLAAEAPRFPELAEPILKAGPERLVADLAARLAAWQKAGLLAVDDPAIAAEQFFGALRGNAQLRALLAGGGADAMPPRQSERYADTAVAAFLRAHRPAEPEGGRSA